MFIVWGSRLCGKVDVVPGICHVATNFGHLYYLPLIPTGSVLVLGEDGEGVYGVKVPLSFKSILVTWGRTALLVASVPAIVMLILAVDLRAHRWDWGPILFGITIPILLFLAYWLPFITRASIERATQFAENEDLPDEIRRRLIEEIKKMYIARGDVQSSNEL